MLETISVMHKGRTCFRPESFAKNERPSLPDPDHAGVGNASLQTPYAKISRHKGFCFMEQRRLLHPGSLYLVLTEVYGNGRDPLDIARQAIAGGVDILQMREKNKTADDLHALGSSLCRLCRENGVVFIVNDDPPLACRLEADGVHLGQEDLALCDINAARSMVGPHKLIGVSTHSPEQVRAALTWDIDYLAFGPIFPTKTKDYHIGTDKIREVLAISPTTVFLIGGIQRTNVDILLDTGAANIALIRDMMEATDVAAQARWYKQKLKDRRATLPERFKANRNGE